MRSTTLPDERGCSEGHIDRTRELVERRRKARIDGRQSWGVVGGGVGRGILTAHDRVRAEEPSGERPAEHQVGRVEGDPVRPGGLCQVVAHGERVVADHRDRAETLVGHELAVDHVTEAPACRRRDVEVAGRRCGEPVEGGELARPRGRCRGASDDRVRQGRCARGQRGDEQHADECRDAAGCPHRARQLYSVSSPDSAAI